MKLAVKARAWLGRANAYFTVNWRVVPFQPILFLFVFLGAVLALTVDVHHPAFADDFAFTLWITLSILCPPMAGVAWYLIKYRDGKPRYFGLLVRFGADVGQFASVSAFIAIIAEQLDPISSEIFAAEIFAAVWWFLVALMVRDVWKLVLVERLAATIEGRRKRAV